MAQGGRVDEGLEVGARLPVGLSRAVELRGVVAVAAYHRDYLTVIRAERDEGGVDLRKLRQHQHLPGLLLISGLPLRHLGLLIDPDDVSGREHLARAVRRNALPVVAYIGPCPFDAVPAKRCL